MNKILIALAIFATMLLSGCGTMERHARIVSYAQPAMVAQAVPPGCYANTALPKNSPPVYRQQNGLLCVTDYDRIATPVIATPVVGQTIRLANGRTCTWEERAETGLLDALRFALIAYAATGNGHYTSRAAAGGAASGMLFCVPKTSYTVSQRHFVQQGTTNTQLPLCSGRPYCRINTGKEIFRFNVVAGKPINAEQCDRYLQKKDPLPSPEEMACR